MVQLVSRQEIGLKKFSMELQSVVGLHQILAGNVNTFLEALYYKLSMPLQILGLYLYLKEIFLVGCN